ncbi:hypothetical protein ACFSJM_06855 [Lactococcus formosensis subsp. bovis]|uniref:hypothetical protein n=1 Tax=Lactococcus formosensis TaxID=1281486 RepID=UPI001BD096F2|nr:hypothetical protein [Lactococcus formosensis]
MNKHTLMNKILGQKKKNEKDSLARKYRRIGFAVATLFLVEVMIGYVDGGSGKITYAAPKQLYMTPDEGSSSIKAEVYSVETLPDHSSRTIFYLTSGEYDYHEKKIEAKSGKEAVKGEILNDRYFAVTTPKECDTDDLSVTLTSNNGTDNVQVIHFNFSVNTDKSSENKFSPFDKKTYDLLYVQSRIEESQKNISQYEATIDAKKKQIQLDNVQITSLNKRLKETTVKTDQKDIQTQIDNLQQAIQQLNGTVKENEENLSDENGHLEQLRKEKVDYEKK